MSVLEIKGEMHELISKVQDGKMAEKLLELIQEFLNTNVTIEDDFEKSMSHEEEAAIRRAIDRSHDQANFISAKEAEKQLSQWLNP